MEQALAHSVVSIRGADLVHYWPMIEHEMDLVPHVWKPWWTKDAILYGVEQGFFQLWGAGTESEIQVVVVTQISEYPGVRVLQAILALGNHIEANLPVLSAAMESFARASGCELFELHGRPGWARKLLRYRPVRSNVVLSFPVSKERLQ